MSKAKQVEPVATYRCSNGHQWQSDAGKDANLLTFPIGMAGRIENVCPHCLLNALSLFLQKANVGRVLPSNGEGVVEDASN